MESSFPRVSLEKPEVTTLPLLEFDLVLEPESEPLAILSIYSEGC